MSQSGPPARDEWRAAPNLFRTQSCSASLTPPAPTTQRKPSSATLSAASRAKIRLIAASAAASKRRLAFSLSLSFRQQRRAACQAAGALRVGDPLAQPQQNVLITGQPRDARLLHHFGQRVQSQRRHVRAHVRMPRMQRFQLAGLLVIVLAARLQVKLPAVAADGHLHDLGGAFVNRGDAHVAPDLLHHVFVRVAVASERLDAGVGCRIARLRGHVLGDGAFGVQAAFAGIDALGSLFDVGAAASRRATCGTISLWVYPCFSESGAPA